MLKKLHTWQKYVVISNIVVILCFVGLYVFTLHDKFILSTALFSVIWCTWTLFHTLKVYKILTSASKNITKIYTEIKNIRKSFSND